MSTPSPVTGVPAIPAQLSALPSVPLGSAGPAQSEWLVHFCSRPPGLAQSRSLDPTIAALIPEQRLHAILGQRRLRGFPPFGAQHPMVCLTESPLPHLQWLITHRRFPPWGIVLNRQWVYDVGGGPTWYVRAEQYAHLDDEQRRWATRLETTTTARSDWLHEREWRIPLLAGDEQGLALPPGAVVAILVGRPAQTNLLLPGPAGVPVIQQVATRWGDWVEFPHWWLDPITQSWTGL